MSLFKIIWNLNTPKVFKKEKTNYSISHNDVQLDNIAVISYALHNRTYRLLRNFVTPSYKKVFLMRNKKGFNTIMFKRNFDIVVTNKDGIIIELYIDYKTGQFSKYIDKAFNIYFFTAGSINHYKLKEKDSLRAHSNLLQLIKSF